MKDKKLKSIQIILNSKKKKNKLMKIKSINNN